MFDTIHAEQPLKPSSIASGHASAGAKDEGDEIYLNWCHNFDKLSLSITPVF